MVIIALLVAPMCDGTGMRTNSCRDYFDHADLLSLETTVRMFAIHHGRPPTQEEGLNALVVRPSAWPEGTPWMQTMPEALLDRWKRPFHYTVKATAQGLHVTLRSSGPDGIPSEDDREHEWEMPAEPSS